MTQENTQETYFGLPSFWFERPDSETDGVFYEQARMVAHIDDATMDAVTDFYREFIPAGANVLDLMSSWLSHLPNDLTLGRVAGLGMNAEELAANPQLTQWCVHNLNENPALPFDEGLFDRALIVVSIQYLTRPVEVLQSVLGSLKPGGAIAIAMSHRLFPTKAIAAFQGMERDDKMKLVGYCLQQAGFGDITFHDRSPLGADPMWIMTATKPTA
jgi:SAM-dependent methyltransferase